LVNPAERLAKAEQLLEARDLSKARTAFNLAQSAGANHDRCAAGRWILSMLEGDFEAAWQESDAIQLRGAPDPHRFWNGEDLSGTTTIVRSLHGFGDTVQMLRYAPLLKEKTSRLIIEVAPRFVELARTFDGVDEVITWGDNAPAEDPAWDVQIETMELPYVFRTTIAALPIFTNYMHLPPETIQHAGTAMRSSQMPYTRPKVGLVWASGDWNPQRSIPFILLGSLLTNSIAEFWNIQGGVAAHDGAGTKMRDAIAVCGDGLLNLAATISNLDLIITVDTLAAHIAGALGKPAWVMLQHAADWRWLTGRTDSPWYPSLRLFRQPEPGDWTAVIKDVENAFACYEQSCANKQESK
jgi:hypothetical protein